MIEFFVSGTPIPKQSYRAVKGGGYLYPRVVAWEQQVSLFARQAMAGRPPMTGDLAMTIQFVFPDHRRRDIDNSAKLVLDGCNGIVFEDDSQVVDLHLTKRVSKQMPGIFVIVENAIDEKLVELPY